MRKLRPKCFHLILTKHYLKKLLFISLYLISFDVSLSQTISVVSQENNQPLEGVTLISQNPDAYTITNAKGRAEFSKFKGAKRIKIRSLGYRSLFLSYKEIEEADFKIRLEVRNFSLDEIVISGTRWQQPINNIPSKIISISPQDIELQNPQTAADLLGVSGNVFIQKSQQGAGSPMIRGFATNRLVYTIDGVRMNNAIFRGGNIQNVINLDPFAIENTEILFGPASVIYGSDAIGGVMSFQTLTPKFSNMEKLLISGKGVTRYSSVNHEQTGHFDVNLGWEKWAFITSLSSWDFDHLRQGRYGPEDYIKTKYPQRRDGIDLVINQEDELLQIPSAYSQVNFMQKIRFQPDKKWEFQYGLHYSQTSTYGRYDRHNRMRNGTFRYAEWNYGPQQWLMNHLNVTHQANHKLFDNMSLGLALQSFEESRIDRNFDSSQRRTRVENVEAYSANLDFIKNIGNRHKLYYGIEYIFNEVNSNGTQMNIVTEAVTDEADRYPEASWTSVAAYVNDEWKLTNALSLQAGLRYNHFLLDADFSNNIDFYPLDFTTAKINNGSLTGSLGGVYRPNQKWTIRTHFSTAFRSPNVDDAGKVFDSEPGSVVVPNPNLDAEYAYNFDVGMVRVFGDAFKLDLTAYYTLLDNALVRRDFQLNGQEFIDYDGQLSRVQALQNAAKANVYGFQLGIEAKLSQSLKFFSDFNYQKGEEELDDGSTSASRHAAPFYGVSRLRYHFKNNYKFELNAIYQGQQSFSNLAVSERSKDEIYAKDANGNNYSPAWYTLNFKVFYQFNKIIGLSGGVENITDQRYRPYSSGLSGPGRNFILSLNFTL